VDIVNIFYQHGKPFNNVFPADKMNLVTLDSDVNKDFISRISTLRGYPTIYYVPEKGAAMMYGGSRDFISLVDYINNAIGYELVKV